jgi:hypothetical protein
MDMCICMCVCVCVCVHTHAHAHAHAHTHTHTQTHTHMHAYTHTFIHRSFRSSTGGRILLVLNTRGGNGDKRLDTRGRGFEALFFMVGRLANMLVSSTPFTNLQYAIGLLESQSLDVSVLSPSGNSEELFKTGKGSLGNMSMAERCFVTCSGLVPYFISSQRMHDAPESLPLWHRRPPRDQVGRDYLIGGDFVTEVTEDEIPDAVRYMGYKAEHFVRTAFSSRFPPGSIKAPVGVSIGQIPPWGAHGDTDPSHASPTRPVLGWDLEEILVGDDVWGAGWNHVEGDRGGKQWLDGDGASDEFAPHWHIVAPASSRLDDVRFIFDLHQPDMALYSFIDSQRRIVMGNTLAQAVPCGKLVNSSCGVSCEVPGTGLNLLQCITRAKVTRCGQPVVDECNNDCSIKGSYQCDASAVAFGALRVASVSSSSSASYGLSVGRPSADGLPDNALYMSHQDISRAGVTQADFAVYSTKKINIILPEDCTPQNVGCAEINPTKCIPCTKVTADELQKRLKKAETYDVVSKLLKGSVLRLLKWFKCQNDPPRCGEIEMQPDGWLTHYQVGHEAWPSCSDFTEESERGARACQDIDINMLASRAKPGLFDIADRDSSEDLDNNELQALQAELEARRRVLEKEIWSRMQQTQRDLYKIKPLYTAGGVHTHTHAHAGGLEFASPHCSSTLECADARYATTLRISSWSEWLGEYIRLGQSQFPRVTTCANESRIGNATQAVCGSHTGTKSHKKSLYI